MARPESIAVAGYYPTPDRLIPSIAGLVSYEAPSQENSNYGYTRSTDFALMDPCAGDGAAVTAIGRLLVGEDRVTYYTCEMEKTRFEGLRGRFVGKSWPSEQKALHADAFRVTVNTNGSRKGVSLLYLNPPYDIDREHGRLEHKFLARFTPALRDEGILLYVVPFYALEASAELLASEYSEVWCFRFPEPEWQNYKQVVLVARRTTAGLSANPAIVDRVKGWSADADSIPELPENGPAVTKVFAAIEHTSGLDEWRIRKLDIVGLTDKIRPWAQTARDGRLVPVNGILPELPVQDLLLRKYPMATPPRPAHIAAGIASGVFNGSRVEPNDPKTGLPSLLVKGVFDREYKTIEEKKNKDGEVKGVVQIQQPKLVTTVLDVSTLQYHTLKPGNEAAKTVPAVADMTTADLLAWYGDSLMQVMERQCPVLYDPRRDADKVPLPEFARIPFHAQGHAVRAIVTLLGGVKSTREARRGKAAILLGEIGSGKSTVSLMSASTIGSRKILVLCPPHLLAGWTNEIAAVLPDADVRVLQSVTDVDDLVSLPKDRTVIAILSRETAKLGHAWGGIDGTCPRCGAPLQSSSTEAAKKRLYCDARELHAATPFARAARHLAYLMLPYAAKDHRVANLLRGRFDLRRIKHYSERDVDSLPTWPADHDAWLDEVLDGLAERADEGDAIQKAIVTLLAAFPNDARTARIAKSLYTKHASTYSTQASSFAKELLFMMMPLSDLQTETLAEMRANSKETSYYGGPNGAWQNIIDGITALVKGEAPRYNSPLLFKNGVRLYGKAPFGSRRVVLDALSALTSVSRWRMGEECGEPLFYAVPQPYRLPLARHISKRHPHLFDFLIVDEGHEYATDGSAQERAGHRLTGLSIPTILMTGSIMNGYAASMFTNMWALSPQFREEFDRDEGQRFVDRYGYRKRLVEEKDEEKAEVVAYGSMSDRVQTTEKIIGNAPGILPLFLLRHLLPIAVTLHKADLAIDLPPCVQSRDAIEVEPELFSRYKTLEAALIEQIRKDQFSEEGLAGRLWGQLAELPSFLDRATADVGNSDDGAYEIRYPEAVGGKTVIRMDPFSADTILPKEEWLLDKIESELAEGRRVMVFSWHVGLLPRLQRLIEERIGEKVPILYADKVSTGKRQDWIDREVIKKNRRVLVTNPVAIQTGLNNLVHFASEVWFENPACNPIVYRQAIGRVDRIGQRLPTRIFFPVYKGTLQSQLYDLLLRKVAVSVSTDGLDPESALAAAGVVEDDFLSGLSIGKQLYAMYQEGLIAEPAPIRRTPPRAKRERNVLDVLAELPE